MASTFDNIWRELVFYNPEVPVKLIQHWVKDGFQEVRDSKLWSWAVAQSQFTTIDAVSAGSITTVLDSTAIVGSGTNFLAAHVGRQMKIGNHIFTVASRSDTTNLVLDRAYPVTGAAGVSYSILTAYVTAPSDFYGFVSVIDPSIPTRLNTIMDQHGLDFLDPTRANTGNPLALVDLHYSADSTPLPMYELWPHQTGAKGIPFLYWKIAADFSDSQELPFSIPDRLIKYYALAEMADWPGTTEKPNPMFSVSRANRKIAQFEALLQKLAIEDGEIYATEVWTDIPEVLVTDTTVRSGPFVVR